MTSLTITSGSTLKLIKIFLASLNDDFSDLFVLRLRELEEKKKKSHFYI